MFTYISKVTRENAEKYGIEIYINAISERELISEILLIKDENILARIYIDNEYSAIKTYNGISIDDDIHITSNKKIRYLCRIIGEQL